MFTVVREEMLGACRKYGVRNRLSELVRETAARMYKFRAVEDGEGEAHWTPEFAHSAKVLAKALEITCETAGSVRTAYDYVHLWSFSSSAPL